MSYYYVIKYTLLTTPAEQIQGPVLKLDLKLQYENGYFKKEFWEILQRIKKDVNGHRIL